MVKLIMGLQGAGKTKQLIHDINEAVINESGSIVCIEGIYQRLARRKL